MLEQLSDLIAKNIDEALANIHTIVVVAIVAVNEKTVDCKPVIARVVGEEAKPLPTFLQVPPVFMRGGATHTAHPIAVGDFGLLLVSERCIDTWYDGMNDDAPNVFRMMDYSDGFVLVGIAPAAGLLTIPTDAIETVGNQNMIGDINITGKLIVNGIDFDLHKHGGVQTGGGTTGTPQQ